jgi:hypothetical protein
MNDSLRISHPKASLELVGRRNAVVEEAMHMVAT